MNCPKCGEKLNDKAKFCSECGYKIPEKKPEEINDVYGLTNCTLDARLTGMLSYTSFLGWFIAYLIGDKNNDVARFHLNQGLVVNLFGLLAVVPILGILWGIFIFVLIIIAVIKANKLKEVRLPIFGHMNLLTKLEN